MSEPRITVPTGQYLLGYRTFAAGGATANAIYENTDENVNPKWLENKDDKKEQYTEEYLKAVGNSEFETMFKVGADGKRNNQGCVRVSYCCYARA